MNSPREIVELLASRHPQISCELEGDRISVEPRTANGFEVWLTGKDDEWIVGCEGWHEHFDSCDSALKCLEYALSGQCRLRVSLRGQFEYCWTLEGLKDGEWLEISTTGLFFFPFWRKRRIEYRQNTLLDSSSTQRHFSDSV